MNFLEQGLHQCGFRVLSSGFPNGQPPGGCPGAGCTPERFQGCSLQGFTDSQPAGLQAGVQAAEPVEGAAQVFARGVQAVRHPLLQRLHIPAAQASPASHPAPRLSRDAQSCSTGFICLTCSLSPMKRHTVLQHTLHLPLIQSPSYEEVQAVASHAVHRDLRGEA